jgi:hypothetical protein
MHNTAFGIISAAALLLASACPAARQPAETTHAKTSGKAAKKPATAKLPAAFARVGKRVSKSLLDQIVTEWFDRPYEYMFARPGDRLTVVGRRYGRFLAGVGGIIYYGGLAKAIAASKGYKSSGFYDLEPIAKLAGLPLYTKEAKGVGGFNHYNPTIVRWGVENLLPDPKGRFGPHTYQQIYHALFSRCFRLFAEARLSLRGGGRDKKEAQAYLRAMKQPKFSGLNYLQRRYASALPAYRVPNNSSNMTPQMAIGFWVRRSIGGSSAELWRALQILLERYDKPWFAQLRKRHKL